MNDPSREILHKERGLGGVGGNVHLRVARVQNKLVKLFKSREVHFKRGSKENINSTEII